ncbi:hypothetical protein [Rhizobium sp. FKY42]|uniref:hypothetical protein n=1 Tax=Rhizobium sp. FKY42 TaxID=2562310 RepID=UPI0010C03F4F|nr:hypothetical protein [Rhizobium sp. FKY42]
MAVSGAGSGGSSGVTSTTTGSAGGSGSGSGTGKISPEGKAFESMLAQGLMSDLDMQKKIFDPLKEALDESKDE